MNLGLSLPNNQGVASVRTLVDIAREAEDLGYTSVWVSEHLFHTTYVAERLGNLFYHDPLTILAAVAGATSTVRLGTSVLVLPWHHPVRLAKTLASIDELSDGRVTLGVGVAVTEDEYANLGVDFHRRGAIANEILEALRILWAQDEPRHRGNAFAFEGLGFWPKPVQDRLPIVVGGASEAAFRRIHRWGDGWHALSRSADEMGEGIERIEPASDRAYQHSVRLMTEIVSEPWDRPLNERRTLRGTVDEIGAMLSAYKKVGVETVVIDANSRDVEVLRALMPDMMAIAERAGVV